MSTNAVNGVSQASPQPAPQPRGVTSAPAATSFGQELDAQSVKTGVSHGHHHHSGASQSPLSSPTTAATAAGVSAPSSIAAALQHLLS
jgi:hypothetical protein